MLAQTVSLAEEGRAKSNKTGCDNGQDISTHGKHAAPLLVRASMQRCGLAARLVPELTQTLFSVLSCGLRQASRLSVAKKFIESRQTTFVCQMQGARSIAQQA